MLELALASAIIGFTLLVSLRTFRIILKGQQVAKSNLRADNLLMSSLDSLKNEATKATYDGTWNNLTNSPLVLSFTASTNIFLGGQKYTIQIVPEWVDIHGSTLTPVTTPTSNQINKSTSVTTLMRFWGQVTWNDYYGPKFISKTAYASYLRQ